MGSVLKSETWSYVDGVVDVAKFDFACLQGPGEKRFGLSSGIDRKVAG
jgi:hypothetical protein